MSQDLGQAERLGAVSTTQRERLAERLLAGAADPGRCRCARTAGIAVAGHRRPADGRAPLPRPIRRCAALLAAAGRPLAAPSANASGRISPTRAEHVLASLGGRIPLILDGGPTGARPGIDHRRGRGRRNQAASSGAGYNGGHCRRAPAFLEGRGSSWPPCPPDMAANIRGTFAPTRWWVRRRRPKLRRRRSLPRIKSGVAYPPPAPPFQGGEN